jgi:hypothetical protein
MRQRDAIIVSGWTWEAFNVPERMALALASVGWRILYCENPVSMFRSSGRPLGEVEEGIFAWGPRFLGHRLNFLPLLPRANSKLLAYQIIKQAAKLKLRDPLFIYPHGEYCLELCREFKRRGFPLIHVCMDYHLAQQIEHVRFSDRTLAIPLVAFEELQQQFDGKIRFLPQFGGLRGDGLTTNRQSSVLSDFSEIPRPRLGYLGNLEGRVSLPLLREFLVRHPEWQFVSFGAEKSLMLPNEHLLRWRSRLDLPAILAGFDIGFMPYDCSDPKNLHCVPLKLFDYFSTGMPVASTPIAYLNEHPDLVYVGSTVGELADAVRHALGESFESSSKVKRIAMAEEHSIKKQAGRLLSLLDI